MHCHVHLNRNDCVCLDVYDKQMVVRSGMYVSNTDLYVLEHSSTYKSIYNMYIQQRTLSIADCVHKKVGTSFTEKLMCTMSNVFYREDSVFH